MKKLKLSIISCALFSSFSYADNFKITGVEEVSINNNLGNAEKIGILKVEPGKNFLKKSIYFSKKNNKFNLNHEPRVVDLGMGNVPVLHQGHHGTCVTFAETAALDALHNAGDYISQECLLALGNYKYNTHEWEMSGWDGLYVHNGPNRLKMYGIVSKDNCPFTYPDTFSTLSPAEYKSLSFGKQWANHFKAEFLPMENINAVREQLDSGNRVVIASLLNLIDSKAGYPIDATHPTGYWRLPDNEQDRMEFFKDMYMYGAIGGHALIITGYDDFEQRFKIRNSWGTRFGDNGDFYMSYEYYVAMVSSAYGMVKVR